MKLIYLLQQSLNIIPDKAATAVTRAAPSSVAKSSWALMLRTKRRKLRSDREKKMKGTWKYK